MVVVVVVVVVVVGCVRVVVVVGIRPCAGSCVLLCFTNRCVSVNAVSSGLFAFVFVWIICVDHMHCTSVERHLSDPSAASSKYGVCGTQKQERTFLRAAWPGGSPPNTKKRFSQEEPKGCNCRRLQPLAGHN